ncbi:MAG: glycosyltransferase [Actinomycetota bacterium]
MTSTFIALTPTYKPVGGVVKVFDYVNHARDRGMPVRIHCPDEFDEELPLFQSDRFAPLLEDARVTFERGMRLGPEMEDIVFFSWPTHWQDIAPRLPRGMSHERVVHIIQNVRHANPKWIRGYATRLLARPMSRILIVPQVLEVVTPYLHPDSLSEVILEGHDWPYFSKQRTGGIDSPLRVAYTTWKSDVGIEVENRLGHDERFEFRSIRSTVGWPALRELYHWSDVFLATPLPEEGFYLPGLEAMAAGALVITSDAGGNRAYCHFGENCLEVQMESPDSYVSALESLADTSDLDIAAMRDSAYVTLGAHTLEAESAAFDGFLDTVEQRSSQAPR